MITYKLGQKAFRTLLASVAEKPFPDAKHLIDPLFKATVAEHCGMTVTLDGDLEPNEYEIWQVLEEPHEGTERRLLQKGTVKT